LKKKGFSDRRLARQLKTTDKVIRELRKKLVVLPV
ncbi:MAG: Carbamoyl-phosphate synthetase large chain, oligomerization domain, partial [Polaromonas sp.]|nr:Carbamoyl-phosphate synthetase large chain, oligomerization domain [Polaromonas sp.]